MEVRDWFHRIDLGNGVVTPGLDDSPNKLSALGMPADLSGKTVLDIGAWDGFFSFEAERRGAIVTASDYYCWSGQGMHSKQGFDIAKKARGSKVKELYVKVEELPNSGLEPFDVVLFLGVLYHAPDPLGYLRSRSVPDTRLCDYRNPRRSFGCAGPCSRLLPWRDAKQ